MGRLIKLVVLLGVMFADAMSAPVDAGARYAVTNITESPEDYEVNPSFAEQGRTVLFLTFVGDANAPRPWDYVLCKTDVHGQTRSYLSTAGVIHYRVQDNGYHVLILRTDPDRAFHGDEIAFYSSRCDWQIWQLDLRTQKRRLVQSANNQPLARGYAKLGVTGLPDFKLGRAIHAAPNGKREIVVQREKNRDRYVFTFYRRDGGTQREIYSTEAWISYRDVEWFPELIWLDHSTFLTVVFRSDPEAKFPQSRGLFSIVKFNLNKAHGEIVYEAEAARPFTKLCYDPLTADVFFQKFDENTKQTELCRLNLNDNGVDIVYDSAGQLGEVGLERQGAEVVFTEFKTNTSDIMRLTLTGPGIQRLVNK